MPNTTDAAARAAPPPTAPRVFSETRLRRLRRCPRAYYFAYVAGRADGPPAAGSPEWLAARLRHTTTLWAAVGTALHDAAAAHARAARAGAPPPRAAALRAAAGAALNRLWRASRQGREAFFASPRRPMLQEVLYGAGADPSATDRARARLDGGLAALGRLDALWNDLRSPTADVRLPAPFLRFLLRDPAAPGDTGVAGAAGGAHPAVVCYATPDLVYRPAAGAPWTVVEFKSGAPDGAVDQVLTYALAARDGLGLAPAVGRRAYGGLVVALGREAHGMPFAVTGADLLEAERRIRVGVVAMAGDGSLPPDGAPARPGPDAFPTTRDPSRCPGCEFRGICHPTTYPIGRAPRSDAEHASSRTPAPGVASTEMP